MPEMMSIAATCKNTFLGSRVQTMAVEMINRTIPVSMGRCLQGFGDFCSNKYWLRSHSQTPQQAKAQASALDCGPLSNMPHKLEEKMPLYSFRL
jgi:hypothetical protein